MEGITMNRREAIRSLSIATGASLLPSTPSLAAVLGKSDVSYAQAVRGTAPVKIRDIKTILTAPNHIRLVVVKVETTQAALAAWSSPPFTHRPLSVHPPLPP